MHKVLINTEHNITNLDSKLLFFRFGKSSLPLPKHITVQVRTTCKKLCHSVMWRQIIVNEPTNQARKICQKEECLVPTWGIDSKGKNCTIKVIKREIPLVWHSYAILLRSLQIYQFIQGAYNKHMLLPLLLEWNAKEGVGRGAKFFWMSCKQNSS